MADSLHGADLHRQALLRHLAGAARACGGDRAAVVWVDEYGPGLVHTHVVLDYLFDQPRRAFPVEPLRKAWDAGVPGAFDQTSDGASLLAVALGSDGTRAWFMVAESVTPRPALERSARERLMFLAGECSAVVLHRDLDRVTASPGSEGAPGFAGWSVLDDLKNREGEDLESRRITQRFAIARLVRMLLEDDLTLPGERLQEQCARARDEISQSAAGIREAELWERTLRALERGDFERLAPVLLELAAEVEGQGHLSGALEIYRSTYDLAARFGAAFEAIEAARFMGRVLRRLSRWTECQEWYEVARGVAAASGQKDRVARALAGIAIVHRRRGNLPAAREGLLAALEPAEESGDRDTVGSIYHDLMSVEQSAGEHGAALRYGWLAVRTSRSEGAQVRGLAGLAGALADAGEYAAAEDAWRVVAKRAVDTYYRGYAYDGLAYARAVQGDGSEFDTWAARADRLNWQAGATDLHVEVLYHRGLACRALRRVEDARVWFERARAFAEEHAFHQIAFQSQDALDSLDSRTVESIVPDYRHAAPPELRLGLREMRMDMVGVGA